MGKIPLDAVKADVVKAIATGDELVGPDGQTLGAVVPPNLLHLWEWALSERRRALDEAHAEITAEEVAAIDAGGGEIPHEEVIKRLGLE